MRTIVRLRTTYSAIDHVTISERRPEQHGAEHDERHRAEHLSDLLDEIGDLTSAPPPEGAEHEAPHERTR